MYYDEEKHSCKSVDSFSVSEDEYDNICEKLLSQLNTNIILQLKSYLTKSINENDENNKYDTNNLKMDEGTLVNAMNKVLGTSKYNLDIIKLFKILDFDETNYVTWKQFLDYVTDYLKRNSNTDFSFNIDKSDILIKDMEHCKKETICSITLIETESHFCYTIISKHGKVGIYDAKIKFLTEYDVFFMRTGNMKRVRDVWITAATYLSDFHYLMLTASDKSIMIYDASTLCHTFVFLITGMTNIPTCLSYVPSSKKVTKSYLVMGDNLGGLTTIVFKQPKYGMFYKKSPDKLTTYFWMELQSSSNEPFCKIKFNRRVHHRAVKNIVHVCKNEKIISCASDSSISIVIQHTNKIIEPYIFNVPRGVICFHYSEELNLLATGGADKRIRLWEPVVTVRPSAIFPLQSNKIMDVVVLAHLNSIMSFNKNGVLMVWNILNQTCIQSVNIKFPSFGILGRPILFGFQSLYHGPARIKKKSAPNNSHNSSDSDKTRITNVWQRPEIIVTCCDHIAIIPLGDRNILDPEVNTFSESIDQKSEHLLLPPPEKNHQPKIPSSWINDRPELDEETGKQIEDISDLKLVEPDKQSLSELMYESSEMVFSTMKELLQQNGLNKAFEKDFLGEFAEKQNMNMKFILHEPKKEKMRLPISQGAPFTALDLQPHNDVKFSVPVPLSIRMQKISGLEYFDDPQQMIKFDNCFSMDTPKSEYTASSNGSANT